MTRALAGFLLALAVVACSTAPAPTAVPSTAAPVNGPSDGPSDGPTLIGACQLIPEVDEIVGQTSVGPPAGYTLNDVDRCLWTYGLDPSRYVTLSIALAAAHDEAIGALGESESVAELGGDARWWPDNSTLSVLSGGNAVQVTLELEPADNTRELAISIARAAMEGLE